MELGLYGKIAFVGGAGSGLGEGVARGLAAEGVHVALCGRTLDRLERVARDIHAEYGVQTLCVPADLSLEADVAQAVAQVLSRFGHVDILFCNTGGPPAGSFDTLSGTQWDTAYQLLLQSAVRLVRGFLPGMRERGWGRILHSTSVAVKQPVAELMLSNSLRAAVTGFSRTLADEVAKDGITVNCVLPGYIRTARLDYLAEKSAAGTVRTSAGASAGASSDEAADTKQEAYSRWARNIPLGRVAEVREFADVVVFLASTNASYVTGQSIVIDGGVVKSQY